MMRILHVCQCWSYFVCMTKDHGEKGTRKQVKKNDTESCRRYSIYAPPFHHALWNYQWNIAVAWGQECCLNFMQWENMEPRKNSTLFRLVSWLQSRWEIYQLCMWSPLVCPQLCHKMAEILVSSIALVQQRVGMTCGWWTLSRVHISSLRINSSKYIRSEVPHTESVAVTKIYVSWRSIQIHMRRSRCDYMDVVYERAPFFSAAAIKRCDERLWFAAKRSLSQSRMENFRWHQQQKIMTGGGWNW